MYGCESTMPPKVPSPDVSHIVPEGPLVVEVAVTELTPEPSTVWAAWRP